MDKSESLVNGTNLPDRDRTRTRRWLPGSVVAAYRKDPALRGANAAEVVLYPGLWALAVHRLVHPMWRAGVPFIPRLLSQIARMVTGVEIHPGATIGKRLFIDHGAGVVIGETTEIGDDVMMYHGVTLGGRSLSHGKRHPTVEDGVTIGAGARVIGPVRIGAGAQVGANAVVVKDVAPGQVAVGVPAHCRPMRPQDAHSGGGLDDVDPAIWI